MNNKCRIKFFPISFFSIILGLSGLIIASQKTESILKINLFSDYLLYFVSILFFVLSFIYLIKILYFFPEVKKEFAHPIKLPFFPTFSISLLLLSIAYLNVNFTLSKIFLLLGLSIHFVLTIKTVSLWIQKTDFKISQINPAWFIPGVGNILIPIAGKAHLNPEISWFFFGIGFFFWLIFLIIFFYRIIFHEPLPEKLLPTLFILIAPPSIGFISYLKLTDSLDPFAKIIYYFALFLTIVLFFQLNMFTKIKFYLSWWAYSFPLASITIASILMFHKTHFIFFKNLFLFLLSVLFLIIILLFIKTAIAIKEKNICIED